MMQNKVESQSDFFTLVSPHFPQILMKKFVLSVSQYKKPVGEQL